MLGLAARLHGDSSHRLPAGCLCQSEGWVEWRGVFASRVAFAPDFFGHFVVQFRSVCWCIFSYVHPHFSAETLSRCIQKIGPRQGATQLESFAQRFKATEYSSQRLFLGTSAEFFWGRSGLHSSIHIFIHCLYILWSLIVIEVYSLFMHCLYIAHTLFYIVDTTHDSDMCWYYVYVMYAGMHMFMSWMDTDTAFFIPGKDDFQEKVIFLCAINSINLCEIITCQLQTVWGQIATQHHMLSACLMNFPTLKWIILVPILIDGILKVDVCFTVSHILKKLGNPLPSYRMYSDLFLPRIFWVGRRHGWRCVLPWQEGVRATHLFAVPWWAAVRTATRRAATNGRCGGEKKLDWLDQSSLFYRHIMTIMTYCTHISYLCMYPSILGHGHPTSTITRGQWCGGEPSSMLQQFRQAAIFLLKIAKDPWRVVGFGM